MNGLGLAQTNRGQTQLSREVQQASLLCLCCTKQTASLLALGLYRIFHNLPGVVCAAMYLC